jgi:hypothetical protein
MGAPSRLLGRPIRYVPITDEQWADAVKERLNPRALDHLSHLWRHFRKGEQRYRATDTVRAVECHRQEKRRRRRSSTQGSTRCAASEHERACLQRPGRAVAPVGGKSTDGSEAGDLGNHSVRGSHL